MTLKEIIDDFDSNKDDLNFHLLLLNNQVIEFVLNKPKHSDDAEAIPYFISMMDGRRVRFSDYEHLARPEDRDFLETEIYPILN